MKQIQKVRLAVQIIFFALAFTTFFTNVRVFMLIMMLLIITSGVFFCGWFCPFGTLQEFLGKLGQKMFKKPYRLAQGIHKYAVFFRYIVLIVGMLGLGVLLANDPRNTFSTLATEESVLLIAGIAMGVFLAASLVMERPFCNYFCYEGGKYGIMSLLRVVTIKRNSESCITCKKCDRSCPMQIQVSTRKNLRHPQCINCLSCVSNCPVENTLKLGVMDKPEFLKKLFS